MTAATIRALGERFDHLRSRHGRDIAIEDLAESVLGVRRRSRFKISDPAAEAIVVTVCKAQGGEGWEELHREVTTGRLKTKQVTRARDAATYILAQLGFADSEIAPLVNRERSSIVSGRHRFLAQAGNDIERARIDRIIETVQRERMPTVEKVEAAS